MSSHSEILIEKSKKIFGDKYDYSKVNYVNNRTKVEIVCSKHGSFFQLLSSHSKGFECEKCGLEKRKPKPRMTTDEFIKRAKKVHGDKYDYSKVNYVKSSEKVEIICPKHGSFFQVANNHINAKRDCWECGINKRIENSEIKKKQKEKN